MKKVATFFAMASVIVALSSCGSKTAENSTEAVDSVAAETMEAAPMEAAPAVDSMAVSDTIAH